MIKYLVKDTSTGKPNNRSFPGKVIIWYVGKVTEQPWSYTENPNRVHHIASTYGYSRRCDAVRGMKSIQRVNAYEEENGYWTHSLEIIEVEV